MEAVSGVSSGKASRYRAMTTPALTFTYNPLLWRQLSGRR